LIAMPAVVGPDADPAHHGDLTVSLCGCLLLCRGKQVSARHPVLPLVRCRLAPERDDAPVDMELAEEGGIGGLFHPPISPGTEPGKPDQGVPGDHRDEMLPAPHRLVPEDPELPGAFSREAACLPAADAPAPFSLADQPVLAELPEVAVPGTGHDQFCRNVPLDPLEPDVLGEAGLSTGHKVDKVILAVRCVRSLLPEPLDRGAGSDQGGVDLQEVGPEGGVREELFEHPAVLFDRRPGEVWHDM